MKKYIDLTLPIVPHWRCLHEDEIIEKCSTDKGDPASVTRFPLQTHWYTHIDAHNMREVKDKFVEFVGLPTALENANGAQIRCVAITEE